MSDEIQVGLVEDTNKQKIKRVFYPLTKEEITQTEVKFEGDDNAVSKLMILDLVNLVKYLAEKGIADSFTHYYVIPLRNFSVIRDVEKDVKRNGVMVTVPYTFRLDPTKIMELPKHSGSSSDIEPINKQEEESSVHDVGTSTDDTNPFTAGIETRAFIW